MVHTYTETCSLQTKTKFC